MTDYMSIRAGKMALKPNRIHKGTSARVRPHVSTCINFFSMAGRRAAKRYGLRLQRGGKLTGTGWEYVGRGEG